jgi:hypothetical protein
MGLRIQLGHPVGKSCANPAPSPAGDFVILDDNGIHSVALDFCNCESAETHTTQLLRSRLFPATPLNPKKASTFRLMKHFQLQHFEGKASAFEYYHALSRATDNIGVLNIKVCAHVPPIHIRTFIDMPFIGLLSIFYTDDAYVAIPQNVAKTGARSRPVWPCRDTGR